jgi:hypothetical protein
MLGSTALRLFCHACCRRIGRLAERAAHRVDEKHLSRNKRFFQSGSSRHRRKWSGDPLNRTVEMIKGMLLDLGGDLGTDSALFDGFVNHDQPSGFLH